MTIEDLQELEALATPQPWEGNLKLPVPLGEVGNYVQECVNSSPGKDFQVIVGAEKYVCHVGNGPTSQVNSILISTLRNLTPELLKLWYAVSKVDFGIEDESIRELEEAWDALEKKASSLENYKG